MPYDLGVIKRQRREAPSISTSTYGSSFVGFYSTGSSYYAVHVFTSSGPFTLPSFVTTTTAQLLVVGGGGGGGGPAVSGGVGGGGGAGGVISSSTFLITTTTFGILVGGGGATNFAGQSSTLTNGSTVLTALGGGGGGAPLNGSGGNGGSGGGGSGSGTGGTSTSGQGNAGGVGGSQTAYAGGGGGAGGVGGAANSGAAGQGGTGTITRITGVPLYFGGGGGGGANAAGYVNGSLTGGGGNGGTTTSPAGASGSSYSGGGGGGGGSTAGVGGTGGSGIVILSYAIPKNLYPDNQSDPYFRNNALLLNATTGTSGNSSLLTYGIFTDFSVNGLSITNNGTTAATINPFDPGFYHSIYFNGSSYLTIGFNTNFNFIHSTTAIVTVEFWAYPTSLTSNPFIFSTNAGNANYVGGSVQITSSGNIVFTVASGGGNFIVQATSAGTILSNVWSHIAVTWNYTGNTGAFYINGNPSGTFVRGFGLGVTSNSTFALTIGQSGSSGNFYNGYISNLRLVNGTVVYSGIFALSREPLSTVQFAPSINVATITSGTSALVGRFATTGTSITDYSTLTNSITNVGVSASTLNPFTTPVNESVYFAGGSSNQRLTLPASSLFDLSGGTWTIEFWMYSTATPTAGNQCRIFMFGTNALNTAFDVGYNNDGTISAVIPLTGSTGVVSAAGAISLNTWYHVAVVSNAGSASIYINGSLSGTPVTITQPASSSPTLYIGYDTVGTVNFQYQGYLSNIRIIKGQAVYTGNFTTPTSSLQATQVSNPYGGSNTSAITAGTSLLTLKYATYGLAPSNFVDYGTYNLGSIPSNYPGQGTFSPFGNNWSTYFNGLTDYLTIPDISAFTIGSNDWTIETWAYLTANTGTAYIAGQFNTSNIAPYGISLLSNKPTLTLANTSATISVAITSAIAISTGTWSHLAFVRLGLKFSVYVNGQEQAYTYGGSAYSDYSINSVVAVPSNLTYSSLDPYDQSQYHSLYFNGSSYLNLPANAGYNFGTGDVTMECWVYPITYFVSPGTASATIDLWSNASGSYIVGQCQLQINTAGTVAFYYATTVSVNSGITSATVIPLSAWTHLAVVRTGTTLSLYINGSLAAGGAGSILVGQALGTTGAGSISRQTNNNQQYFNGYISNVRIVKGLALYSGSLFAVQSSPLSNIQNATLSGASSIFTNTTQLLTGKFINPSRYFFDDYSPNNFVLTNNGGVAAANLYPPISSTSTFNSMYFNGSSQYLSATKTGGWLSGDHTVEAWIYLNAYPSITACIAGESNGTNIDAWEWTVSSTGIGIGYRLSGSVTSVSASTSFSLSTWYHVAFSRSGTTVKSFVNGLQVASGTITGWTTQNILSIGYLESNFPYSFNGYISNFRIVNGIAVYTGNFTVPSTQLTTTQFANQNGNNTQAITTGTSLLIARSSTIINEGSGSIAVDYSVVPNYITRVGNTFTATNFAPPITSTSTYNSLYFDGSSQYLTIPNSAAFSFDANFTIEFWAYIISAPVAYIDLVGTANEGSYLGTGNSGWVVAYYTTGNYIRFSYQSSSAWIFDSPLGLTVTLNTWHHIAVVRNGTTITGYLNGVPGTTPITSGATLTSNLYGPYIGAGAGNPYGKLNGYLSNLRIVKGLAVYTGAFIRPTQPLALTQPANPYGPGNGITAAGSLSFNGSGQYLTAGANTDWTFMNSGLQDYTMECWFYTNTIATGYQELFSSASYTVDRGVEVAINGTLAGQIAIIYTRGQSGSNTGSYTVGGLFTASTWNHMAATFVASTKILTIFVNGVEAALTTGYSKDLSAFPFSASAPTSPLTIGRYAANGTSGGFFNGYITNLRITKSILYNSVFNPLVPLGNISQTEILLLVSSDANKLVDATGKYTSLTNVSGVTFSTVVPAANLGGSLYFAGSGQYLTTPSTVNYNLYQVSFTMECWVYVTGTASPSNGGNTIWTLGVAGSIFYSGLQINNDYSIVFYTNNLALANWYIRGNFTTPAAVVTAGQWTHIAAVRDFTGNTFKIFVNGLEKYTTNSYFEAGSSSDGQSGTAYIGTYFNNYNSDGSYFRGYITNFRLVKGSVVYSANFTPTGPLENITNTKLLLLVNNSTLSLTDNSGTPVTITNSTSPVVYSVISPFGSLTGIQAIATGTYTTLLTLLPTSATNIVDYSTNTSVITIGSGTVSLSTLTPFTTISRSLYFNGNGSLTATPPLLYAAGSLVFNGSSYVSYPTNAAWALGSSDFTVECWFYQTAYPGTNQGGSLVYLWHQFPGRSFAMYASYNGVGGIGASWNTSGGMSGGPATSLNTWYHAAFVRNGANFYLYLNGQQVATTTAVTITGSSDPLFIGANNDAASPTWFFNGYITNVRIVKGTAVYTSSFSPTLPLTAVPGTSLLLTVDNNTNRAVDTSGNNFTPTISGATFSSSVIPSYNPGWLNYGDHTVEAWVNLNTATFSNMLIAGTYDGVSTTGWEWSINNYWMTLSYNLSGGVTTFTSPLPLSNFSQLLTDSSSGGLTITNNGVTFNSANPNTSYYGTLAFGGSAYLTTPNTAALQFGSSNFTIEAWIYPTTLSVENGIYGKREVGQFIGVNFRIFGTTNKLCMQIADASGTAWGVNTDATSGDATMPAVVISTWQHVALVRNGSSFRIYLNGVGGAISTYAGAITDNTAPSYIGKSDGSGGNQFFRGYISNFRAVKGTAVYTNNFTVPNTPPSTTQNAGTNVQAILTASYTSLLLGVSLNPSPIFTPNTWNHVAFTRSGTTATMYVNGVASSSTVISNYTEQPTLKLGYIGFSTATSTYLTGSISNFRIVSGVAVYTGTNFTPPTGVLTTQQPTNPWGGTNTNAITFNTSTRFLTAIPSTQIITPYDSTASMRIGTAGSAITSMYPGYLSNFRMVTGTALYTGNFTPSSSPLARIDNTSLLIAANNTHEDDSVYNQYITTGTVNSSPAITKFTPYKIPGEYNKSMVGGSVYFNTSTAGSQNLNLGTAATSALGSGDFTVECWIYPTLYNSLGGIILDWRTNGGTTANVPVLYLAADGSLRFQATGGTDLITSTRSVFLNTWNHISLVRNGSTIAMYINGYMAGIASPNITAFIIQTLFLNSPVTASNQTFYGYISSVRILVGRSIYNNANTTVPTTALTTSSNTQLITLQNNLIDNSTNSNFVRLLTANVTTATVVAPYTPFGGSGSAYFNSQYNYLTLPVSNSFAFGTGDFTIEAWIYPTTRNAVYGSVIVGPISYLVTTDWVWMVYPSGLLYFQIGAGTGVFSTAAVPLNQWSHVACVRYNALTTFYINGQINGSGTPSVNTVNNTIKVAIGSDINGNAATTFNGYISNLHLVKGTAKYITSFTPPMSDISTITNTVLLTLLSTETTFIDRSINSFAITNSTTATSLQAFSPFNTNYSTYFDGSSFVGAANFDGFNFSTSTEWTVEAWVNPNGNYASNNVLFAKRNAGTFNALSFNGTTQYLAVVNSTAFKFGTSDFTIECWANYIAGGTNNGVWHLAATTLPAANSGLALAYNSSAWRIYYAGTYSDVATNTMSTNNWNHVALVRSSTVLTLYVNGVGYSVATNDTTNYNYTTNLAIGGYYSTTYLMNGYIANFRIVNGTAVYSGNFTIPNEPLTTTQPSNAFGGVNTNAITSGTVLLIGQFDGLSNNIVDRSYTAGTIITNANTVAGTTLGPTFNTSVKFDGSSQYLTAFPTSSLNFGQSDFTVEAWVYPTVAQSTDNLIISASGIGGSLSFNGTSQYLKITNSVSFFNAFGNLGTGSKTIEFWTYYIASGAGDVAYTYDKYNIFGNWVASAVNGRFALGINTFDKFSFTYTTSVSAASVVYTTLSVPKGTWTHIAFVCVGTSAITIYINGVGETLTVDLSSHVGASAVVNDTSVWYNIGGQNQSGSGGSYVGYYNGYITNFRVVNGQAVYTSNFIVPTTPLGLTQSTNSSTNVTSNTTILLLNVASSATYITDTSTSSFTIANTTTVLYSTNSPYSGGINGVGFFMGYSSTATSWGWGGSGGGWDYAVGAGRLNNVWQHLAVSRSGTNMRMFVNGIQAGLTQVNSSTYDLSIGNTYIGGQKTGYNFAGYISNVRAMNGVSLYTSNFTVPTAPLTKYRQVALPASGSINFNNSPISLSTSSVQALGSNNFTIEFWMNSTSTSNSKIMGNGTGTTYTASTNSWMITFNGSNEQNLTGSLSFNSKNNTGTDLISTATNLNDGSWHHMAIVRSSSTFNLYVDGTLSSTTNNTSTIDGGVAETLNIGSSGFYGNTNYTGYLSNLRIVRGQAIYTGNFTAPTQMLQTTQNSGTNILAITTARNVALLTAQYNLIADYSTNALPINVNTATVSTTVNPTLSYPAYSAAFNITTSSQYLQISTSSFSFTTGTNFTVEAWVYLVGYSTTASVLFGTAAPLSPNYVPVASSTYSHTSSSTPNWGWEDSGTNYSLMSAGGTGTWQFGAFAIGVQSASGGARTTALLEDKNYYLEIAITATTGNKAIVIGLARASVSGTANYSGIYLYDGNIYINDNLQPGALGAYVVGDVINVAYNPTTNKQWIGKNGVWHTLGGYPGLPASTGISGGSLYFNGTNQYLTTAYSTALFDWYTSGVDYTVECWIYPTTYTGWYSLTTNSPPTTVGNMAFNAATNYWSFGIGSATGQIRFYYYEGSAGGQSVVSTNTVPLNYWSHIAMTKTSSGITLFVNGLAQTTTAIIGTPQSSASYALTMGAYNTYYQNGYVTNLRIVKGVAVYVGNFTIPTSALNTTQSSALTNTSGSLSFAGGANSIILPVDSRLAVGTSDFTIEFWIYPTANMANFTKFITSGVGGGLSIETQSDGNRIHVTNYSTTDYLSSTNALTLNAWTHVAVVRISGTLTIYLNGAFNGSVSNTVNFTQIRYIGGWPAYFTGYLTNIRLIVGTGYYTGPFTGSVPTSPLTTVTNTKLLLLASDSGSILTDSSGVITGITNSSSPATYSVLNPFGVPSGIRAISTASYTSLLLKVGSSVTYITDSSTTPNTIANPNTLVYSSLAPPGQGGGFNIAGTGALSFIFASGTAALGGPNTSGQFRKPLQFTYATPTGFYGYNATGWYLNLGQDINSLSVNSDAAGTWTTNLIVGAGAGVPLITWTHIAMVRNGNELSLFKNGSLVAFTVGANDWNFSNPNNIGYIGYYNYYNNGTTSTYLKGYVSNLRIVSRQALYQSSFTPLTAPFENLQISSTGTAAITTASNVQLLTAQSNIIVDNSTNNLSIANTATTPVSVTANATYMYTGYITETTATVLLTANFIGTETTVVDHSYNTASITLVNSPTISVLSPFGTILPSNTSTSYQGYLNAGTGYLGFSTYDGSNQNVQVSTTALTTGTWNHVAYTYNTLRNYHQLNMYVNGNRIFTTSSFSTLTTTQLVGSPVTQLTLTNNPTTITSSTYIFGATNASDFEFRIGFDGIGLATGYLGMGYINLSTMVYTRAVEWAWYATYNVPIARRLIYYAINPAIASNNFRLHAIKIGNNLTISIDNVNNVAQESETIALLAGTNYKIYVYYIKDTYNDTRTGTVITDTVSAFSAITTASVNNLTSAIISDSNENFFIGGVLNTSENFNGYMSNLRVVKDAALYLGSFIGVPTSNVGTLTNTVTFPATTAIKTALLTLQDEYVKDNSIYSKTLVVGGAPKTTVYSPFITNNLSGYFNGKSVMIFPNTTSLNIAGGPWTIELWLNHPGNYTNYNALFAKRNTSGAADTSYYGYLNITSGYLSFYNGTVYVSTTIAPPNVWNHIAYVYDGTAINIYLNGLCVYSTVVTVVDTVSPLVIGAIQYTTGPTYDHYLYGYMSNFRIIKGTALYNSTFNPSQIPLALYSGNPTNLLLNFTDSKAIDYSGNTTIRTNNTTTYTISNLTTKYNQYSLSFNGSSDVLIATSSTSFVYGSNDFTWEMWIYPTSSTWNTSLTYLLDHGGLGAGGSLRYNSDRLSYFNATVATSTASTSLSISTSTWTHIAVARQNAVTSVFINGIFVVSTQTDTYNYTFPSVAVGNLNTSTTTPNYFQGYMEDVRLTKGVARYASQVFVPPIKLSNR